MATREYTVPVGTDLIDAQGNGWQIAGIKIDNPSGSWLRVSGIEAHVPPFTLGWSAPILPAQWNVSVLFVASPSGTPSQLVGAAVTVRLSDLPLPASAGFASGAAEYQQPGRGDVLYRLSSFLISETLGVGDTLTPTAGHRIILVSLTVAAGIATAAAGQFLRTMAQINLIDGFGAQLFPPVVISPEAPVAGPMTPTPRQLGVGGTVEFAGLLPPGGGRASVDCYLVYYEQEG